MNALSLARWIAAVRRTLAATALGVIVASPLAAQADTFGSFGPAFGASQPAAGPDDFGPTPDGFGSVGYETRKPVNDRDNLWQTPPQYQPAAPAAPAELSEGEQIDLRLSARYGNPVVGRFVTGTSPERLAQLYLEASQLIDSRHYEPSSYQQRVDRAVANLRHAVRNEEFVRVNRIAANPAAAAAFDRDLTDYMANRQVRTSADALRVMTGVASIAGRNLNLAPSAVAAEFLYGAAESLDKYSAFNPEAPAKQPSAATGLEDHVVGIGVEIKPHADGVIVVKPVRGGPAEKAGLQAGDVIVGINGQRLGGQTLDFAVDRIAGPQGSPVLIAFERDGRENSVSLRREQVRVYSVSEVRMLDDTVGYIKLDKFAEASDAEMDEALWSLYNRGMKSLVFDLRGNPGGLLTAAISLSDKFLPGGNIVSTKGRTTEDNSSESAHRAKTWKTPMVVLVDGNSASASEIFAAAIQENGRGVIVGRKSYGKGTVQTHFPLRTVAGNLKLTTARFYSPNGRVMAGAGVTPDVTVTNTAPADQVVPLDQDEDVRQGYLVAQDTRTREMAETSGRNLLIGQR